MLTGLICALEKVLCGLVYIEMEREDYRVAQDHGSLISFQGHCPLVICLQGTVMCYIFKVNLSSAQALAVVLFFVLLIFFLFSSV